MSTETLAIVAMSMNLDIRCDLQHATVSIIIRQPNYLSFLGLLVGSSLPQQWNQRLIHAGSLTNSSYEAVNIVLHEMAILHRGTVASLLIVSLLLVISEASVSPLIIVRDTLAWVPEIQ